MAVTFAGALLLEMERVGLAHADDADSGVRLMPGRRQYRTFRPA
jgi:hypothetical protein